MVLGCGVGCASAPTGSATKWATTAIGASAVPGERVSILTTNKSARHGCRLYATSREIAICPPCLHYYPWQQVRLSGLRGRHQRALQPVQG